VHRPVRIDGELGGLFEHLRRGDGLSARGLDLRPDGAVPVDLGVARPAVEAGAVDRPGDRLADRLLEPLVQPDVNLVSTLISLRGLLGGRTKETARLVVRKVVCGRGPAASPG
jgi:hypothetical protein